MYVCILTIIIIFYLFFLLLLLNFVNDAFYVFVYGIAKSVFLFWELLYNKVLKLVFLFVFTFYYCAKISIFYFSVKKKKSSFVLFFPLAFPVYYQWLQSLKQCWMCFYHVFNTSDVICFPVCWPCLCHPPIRELCVPPHEPSHHVIVRAWLRFTCAAETMRFVVHGPFVASPETGDDKGIIAALDVWRLASQKQSPSWWQVPAIRSLMTTCRGRLFLGSFGWWGGSGGGMSRGHTRV